MPLERIACFTYLTYLKGPVARMRLITVADATTGLMGIMAAAFLGALSFYTSSVAPSPKMRSFSL